MHLLQLTVLTPLGSGETVVQVEDDFLHKVLNVAVLRPPDKHHPVVGESFNRGFLPNLGPMA